MIPSPIVIYKPSNTQPAACEQPPQLDEPWQIMQRDYVASGTGE